MRKQLKEVSGHISRSIDILKKVSSDENIPSHVRSKSLKIVEALELDAVELEKMRSY